MFRTKNVLRAAAPVAVLALALTACGGSDSDDASGGKGKDTSKSEGQGKQDPAQEDPAEEADGSLKAGASGTGVFEEDDTKITYDIAAQKVDVGTEAEAAKLVSDPKKAKGLVAATAHVKFTLKSGGTVERSPDAGRQTELYADGTRGGLLIGASEDAAGCDDTVDIENWKAGESYTLCETYMVPKGTKSIEVRWTDEDEKTKLSWTFENK